MVRRLIVATLLCGVVSAAAELSTETPQRRDIRGGSAADPLQYPSVVGVRHVGVGVCSGSLIAEDWVLTALHCVDGAYARDLSYRCSSDVSVTHGGLRADVCEIVAHDLYDPFDESTYAYDLALLRIEPFTSRTVRSVGLIAAADEGLTEAGTETVTVARAQAYGFHVDALEAAAWPLRECPANYPAGFLCTQADIEIIAEDGDSGSPLLVERDGEWAQVGTLLRVNGDNQVIGYADLRLRAEWIRSVSGVSGGPSTPGTTTPPGGTETTPEVEGACPVDSAPRVILEYRDGRWTVRTEATP